MKRFRLRPGPGPRRRSDADRGPRAPARHPISSHERTRALARGLIAAAILQLSACKTGPDLSADYAQTAQENYELAVGEFQDKDYEEAIQYADFVRIRFPFSRYAVEAELLIARSEFEQGNYLTAQDAFKQFAKLHPTHEHVRNGWVSFMAAAAAYMNAPQQSFFLFPPASQRDQSALREALLELEYYYDHYQGTQTVEYADALREDVLRRLLEHELYVARYYLDRDKPEAAIGRLEAAHARYPGIGLDAEVLFLLGITYLRMEEIELARSTFSELQSQHPNHHHGKQARIYLKYIFDTYGPADPSRPRPDRSPPVPISPPQPKNKENPTRPELAPQREAEQGVESPGQLQPPRSTPPKSAPPESTPPQSTPTQSTPTQSASPEGQAGSASQSGAPSSEAESPEATPQQ